jgi:hypothetical protein
MIFREIAYVVVVVVVVVVVALVVKLVTVTVWIACGYLDEQYD